MLGIIGWSVGDIQLNRGKFGFSVKIELCDSIIKQQRGGYLQESEAKHEREKVIGDLYSKRYAVYANTSVQNFYEFWLEEVKNIRFLVIRIIPIRIVFKLYITVVWKVTYGATEKKSYKENL